MLPPNPPPPRDDAPSYDDLDEPDAPAVTCAQHEAREAARTCPRCDAYACDECLAPGASACARCVEEAREVFPWERRRELGLVRALGASLAGVVLRPHAFFGSRSVERIGPTRALGLAIAVLSALDGALVTLLDLPRLQAEIAADPIARQLGLEVLATREYVLGQLATTPITYVLGTYLTAYFWWLGLKLAGGAKGSFTDTVRALVYVGLLQLPALIIPPLSLVPGGVGASLSSALTIFFVVVSLSLQIVAMSAVHRIERWRAVAAFLVSIVLAATLACCVVTVIAVQLASHIPLPS